MPWKAIACSEIGTSHQKSGLPCQDYTKFIRLNNAGQISDNGDFFIGAVSDGAGSCKYSDIGSKLAVTTALKHLTAWLKWLKDHQKDPSPEILKESAKKAFAQTLGKVIEAFNGKAEENTCSPKDFSCTLLVVVTAPDWLAAMQIGDGFIVTRQPESEYQLLFHPSKGEYASETTFVTASNALEEMQVKTLFGKQQFICAASDGLERIAINMKSLEPHPPFFEMFEKALEIRDEKEEKLSTKEWLKSKDVNNRTDDDKTILVCWYEDFEPGENPSYPRIGEKYNTELTVFAVNVLSGIFWNSLYHDLFVQIEFNNSIFRWIISINIVVVLTAIIILVNLYIYKPLKSSKSQYQKVKALIISSAGLGLGGLFYYSIYLYILYLSKL
ncbi:PP2C family serine/threonine-protein phosphatase [Okeania sp. SIO2B3]|uniref:PP2C family serine/threonine-protein phosphatase n=1 Tax=Okeania sp. SIO2B3 TaxID=2607784 RepID=UPI0013BFF88F|nr:PP2C family serine/threonine-protein phosphatase [Okeania sp. SIO2B3]NET40493.1 protein phosphatase 2C domain-containing protein [Okeania sp. SIO2B3]